MPHYLCAAVREFVAGPQGMLIFTGPAGSGKTTSIYAILKEQPASRMNIITGECPIEVVIPDITQDEISEGGRYTFPDFVRSLVRRQPSIRRLPVPWRGWATKDPATSMRRPGALRGGRCRHTSARFGRES